MEYHQASAANPEFAQETSPQIASLGSATALFGHHYQGHAQHLNRFDQELKHQVPEIAQQLLKHCNVATLPQHCQCEFFWFGLRWQPSKFLEQCQQSSDDYDAQKPKTSHNPTLHIAALSLMSPESPLLGYFQNQPRTDQEQINFEDS